jgi:hypothetical protein
MHMAAARKAVIQVQRYFGVGMTIPPTIQIWEWRAPSPAAIYTID